MGLHTGIGLSAVIFDIFPSDLGGCCMIGASPSPVSLSGSRAYTNVVQIRVREQEEYAGQASYDRYYKVKSILQ